MEPGWQEIDPLKSATADIALVESGLKSRREVIAARGRDFDAVNAEIESDERTPGDRAKALAELVAKGEENDE
ncbi:hypothetical protein AB2N04_10780 [Nitratireductor sp. GISD-1A_MAKvit]|uniref:hypothetical protein n=1 Tax=Nitratireductor sp. GISD-1A_MAKvit TaxID=3234198 RepID=UPI00346533BA